MSAEQAQACIERMKQDPAFRQKVMEHEDEAERIACIRSEGFDCTAEELNLLAMSSDAACCQGGVIGANYCVLMENYRRHLIC
ncbi:Nif11-like leader peptide family RiPP precursor [Chlorobium sp. N1]|uniref:Nif11-like leader peptide family RiPP precursor n=1 Tax=Chlorobium sp. N1 TaxID=2491138 RepID=UPI0010402D32|nr:Nif11-like leader peptide family RiPP precursor [Chlorobium sp. N1]TCD47938.1 Nif11-like leader peptide family natural product precursor [Chlorobium sp. N1]